MTFFECFYADCLTADIRSVSVNTAHAIGGVADLSLYGSHVVTVTNVEPRRFVTWEADSAAIEDGFSFEIVIAAVEFA